MQTIFGNDRFDGRQLGHLMAERLRIVGKWGSSGSGAASVLMPPGIAKTDDQDKGRFAPEKVENTGNPPFGAPPSFRLHGV